MVQRSAVNSLHDWQKRLEEHFASLSAERRHRNLPLFALEHGLDREDRVNVASLLRKSLEADCRLESHWLVWVIYAAEQGYDYDGEEYWSTFETRTPGWTSRADRASLRNWFRKFHSAYGGLKPTGAWADWFSIIAWPITHALLPKDLQQQLARALYQLRFQVARRIDHTPKEIGRYVARFSYDASSRFRNFLEQEEIVGRIILALLSGRTGAEQHFIHPPTLSRIVDDLQEARNARAWLRDARQALEHTQIKGVTTATPTTRSHIALEQSQRQTSSAAHIRPRLTLRRTGLSEWTPVVELPSLKPITDLHPDTSQFLRRTRCTVTGSTGALPAGWLASGDQRRVLIEWPAPGQPVIKFESPNAIVEHLLVTDGCISSGPTWLFRVGTDGLAREVVGRLVRPGQRYVFVAQGAQPTPTFAVSVNLRCADAGACAFEVPSQLSAGDIATLKACGLSVAQTVRVRPAGLGARSWDGEGFGEWLEGESPCFALESDFPVITFDVRLNGEPSVRVPNTPEKAAKFIKLPALAAGHHQLVIKAVRGVVAADVALAPVEGFVSLAVRPSQPWTSGSASHNGLIVTTEPVEPTLDSFWEGDVGLQIVGPSGRRVSVAAELHDGAAKRLALETVAEFTLPIAPNSWERSLRSFLQRKRDPWAYLTASAGALIVDGEALGDYRVPLTRDVTPVRWVWHRTPRSTALRLIDDHEGDDPLKLSFYSFASPAEELPISRDTVATAWAPKGTGGLCVASYGVRNQALVASMPQVVDGPRGLLVEPSIRSLPTGDEAVVTLLDLIRLWSTARLAGPLADQRRDRALRGLSEYLVRLVYGVDWAAAEAAFQRSPCTESDFRRLADRMGGPPAFAYVLARDALLYQAMKRDKRLIQYADLASRYGIAAHDTSAAVLDLADIFGSEAPIDRVIVSRLLSAAHRSPVVARGARLLTLATPTLTRVSPIISESNC